MVDLDDVIYPFIPTLRRYLVEHHGYNLDHLVDPTDWVFAESWGLTDYELYQLFDEAVNSGYLYVAGEPYEGAVTGLTMLQDEGHSIHIATASSSGRIPLLRYNIAEWLERKQVPHESIHFTKDKTFLNVEYAVDDNPTTVRTMRVRNGTRRAFLMTRSWNVEADAHEGGPGLKRVSNLVEFADVVAGYEQGKALGKAFRQRRKGQLI